MLANGKLNRKKVTQNYERKVCQKLRDARLTVEGTSINVVFNAFKDVVTEVAAVVTFYEHCLNIIIELVRDIQTRFPFEESIHATAQCLDPKNAIILQYISWDHYLL